MDKFKKTLLFLQEQNETTKSDKKDVEYCENCKCNKIFVEYYFVCEKCGECDAKMYFEKTFNKKVYYYNKLSYFVNFLLKIQGLGKFDKKKSEFIRGLIPEQDKIISLRKIRRVLLKNNISLKYLRYVPDIYYHVNKISPNTIKQRHMLRMINDYKKVIQYEKSTRIKLPTSKRYFAYRFLEKYNYEHLLVFLNTNFTNIDVKKYDECYEKLFK
jgi:hypothetical protein